MDPGESSLIASLMINISLGVICAMLLVIMVFAARCNRENKEALQLQSESVAVSQGSAEAAPDPITVSQADSEVGPTESDNEEGMTSDAEPGSSQGEALQLQSESVAVSQGSAEAAPDPITVSQADSEVGPTESDNEEGMTSDAEPGSSQGASIRNDEVLRIVLVGKTGSGKSATGNTILGSEAFHSEFSLESVTNICKEASGAFRKVSLVDTPGLFDTRVTVSEDETLKRISKCISLAAPGPHGFLLVIQLGRFTDEEQRSVEIIQKVFGQKSDEYTMILFTNGDKLRGTPVEEKLKNCPKLQELIRACKGRYHVFNNETKDPSQVNELLEKIKQMVLKNGGSHYTNEMFQEAAKKIKEEKERERKKLKDQVRQEMISRDIKVVGATTVASTVACATVGTAAAAITAALVETAEFATLASVCGPVGTGVGALVGLIIGGVLVFRKHRENRKTSEEKKPLIH